MKYYRTTAFLISAALLSACGGPQETRKVSEPAPVAVTLGRPATQSRPGIAATGRVEALQSAAISTRLMGLITHLPVKAGDVVRKGQVLATISSNDIQARGSQTDALIAEAEAHYRNARRDYERFTALFEKQSASEKELENVRLQYQSAEARVAAARQMRNEVKAMGAYATLLAPFDGVITQKNAEAGALASPGMPLLVVEGSGALQVQASIPETEIARVRKGMEAELEVGGKHLKGTVIALVPSTQFTGGQYLVKISLPSGEKGLYSGMYAHVFLPTEEAQEQSAAVLVPQSAIVYRDQLTGLYTPGAGNIALLRWVRLGRRLGNDVEVLSGLSAGEAFVLQAEGKIYNGAPLRIR